MPSIEIRYFTGDVEQIKLSKKQPVSIGRQKTNDVCIDEEGVALLHCRVAWNKSGSGYEVAAANLDGVDVNGKVVRHAALRDGDVIRVGSVDIAFLNGNAGTDEPPEKAAKGPGTRDADLKPITEENIYGIADPELGSFKPERAESPEPKVAEASATKRKEKKKARLPEKPKDDLPDDLFSGEIEIDQAPPPTLKRGTKQSSPRSDDDEEKEEKTVSVSNPRERTRPDKSNKPRRRVRPGEEDPLRSPLVLGLGGGVIALLLIGLTFYFMIGRRSSQNLYQGAVDAQAAGQYGQAIQQYNEFLKLYPRHNSADAARLGLGKSQVEARISGSSPDWKEGLVEVEKFLKDNRERDDYEDYRTAGLEYAERIASTASQVAKTSATGTDRRRELLETAKSANALLNRYGSNETPPELTAKLEAGFRDAEAAILKQETRNAAVKQIEAALEARQPMVALAARDELLGRYADFSGDPELAKLLNRTLEVERSLIVQEDVGRQAVAEEPPDRPPVPLTLLLHARARSDELSEGRIVVAAAKDCCFGVDTITGEPVWRRVVGLDSPFFPMEVATSVPGLLLFDTVHRELVLVDRNKGSLIWRQPMEETASGPPLVHEGQVYLPTDEHHLYRIDLETGQVTSRLALSQRIVAPPVLAPNGSELFVAGDQALLYTVSLRPMECRRVTYLGHRAGAIEAPLVSMGSLLLVAENDRAESSVLRVFATSEADKPPQQVAAERVEGHVRDEPILRGRQLFVATDRHVILAFSVSDDPNQSPVVSAARFAMQQPHDGPFYLSAGPDGHLWMASSALRKFQLLTEGFQLDPNAVAVGYTSQPLQLVGGSLFVGRRLPYSGATVFTQFDREAMTSQWRVEVGAAVLCAQPAGTDAAVCVTESGHVFRIAAAELERGGLRKGPVLPIDVPDTLAEPLRASSVGNGRVAVFAGGTQPHLWVVNSAGQLEGSLELLKPLEAEPAMLQAGVVLPMSGRLKLAPLGSTGAAPDDYLAPVEERPAGVRWISLTTLDETQLLALDSGGALHKIQYRSAPVATLTQVAAFDFGTAVDQAAAYHDGRLILTLADGRVQTVNAATLETLAETRLDAAASAPLWAVGDRLIVEVGGTKLDAFTIGTELNPLWNVPLEGARIAGRPVAIGGSLYVALSTGDVLKLNAENGETTERISLGQPLNAGLTQIGNALAAPSIDGSLHPVEILPAGN